MVPQVVEGGGYIRKHSRSSEMLAPSTVSCDLFLIGGLFRPALRNAAVQAGEETNRRFQLLGERHPVGTVIKGS